MKYLSNKSKIMWSKCGNCNGFTWEINEEEPNGAAYKVFFVRCSGCKVPIGVLPYYDTHSKLQKIENAVIALGNTTTSMLGTIDANIRRLFQR